MFRTYETEVRKIDGTPTLVFRYKGDETLGEHGYLERDTKRLPRFFRQVSKKVLRSQKGYERHKEESLEHDDCVLPYRFLIEIGSSKGESILRKARDSYVTKSITELWEDFTPHFRSEFHTPSFLVEGSLAKYIFDNELIEIEALRSVKISRRGAPTKNPSALHGTAVARNAEARATSNANLPAS